MPLASNIYVADICVGQHSQLDQQPPAVCQCSVDAVGWHNIRYAIDMARPRRWKVWVAVDTELRTPEGSDSRTISKQGALDASLVSAVTVMVVHDCEKISFVGTYSTCSPFSQDLKQQSNHLLLIEGEKCVCIQSHNFHHVLT